MGNHLSGHPHILPDPARHETSEPRGPGSSACDRDFGRTDFLVGLLAEQADTLAATLCCTGDTNG
jgi:hypothetical protein